MSETLLLRCERTGNPVGTDTLKVGWLCDCQGCRAAAELSRLRAEVEAFRTRSEDLSDCVDILERRALTAEAALVKAREALSIAREGVSDGQIIKLIDAALRSLPSQPRSPAALGTGERSDGWRTMESAPKDGSRILAWHKDWETSHTAQWYGSYWGAFYTTGPFLYQPTHWRPLPSPPEPCETVNASKDGGAS